MRQRRHAGRGGLQRGAGRWRLQRRAYLWVASRPRGGGPWPGCGSSRGVGLIVERVRGGELLELLPNLRGELGGVTSAHGGMELIVVLPKREQRREKGAGGVGQDEEAIEQAVHAAIASIWWLRSIPNQKRRRSI